MLSAAQQMLQDSRTKIELLRMQMVKINQFKGGEVDGSHGTSAPLRECSLIITLHQLPSNTH